MIESKISKIHNLNVRFKPSVLEAMRTISYETRKSIQVLVMEGIEIILNKYSEVLAKKDNG